MSELAPGSPKLSVQPVPTKQEERLEPVDILRGLALLAILIENMASYSGMSYSLESARGTVERVVTGLIVFLLQGKSYSLLCFLLGWGVAAQMKRAELQGARFAALHLRRMLVLLGLGIIHGAFIWYGDVLTVYALLGILLLPLRKRSGRVLLAIAVLALLIPIALNLPMSSVDAFRGWYDSLISSALRPAPNAAALYGDGSYAAITRLRLRDYLRQSAWVIYYGGSIFSMFALGLYVGRRMVLQQAADHLLLVRRTTWISLAVGLICNAGFLVWSSPWAPSQDRFILVACRTLGALAFVLFYAGAVTLLVRNEVWRRRLASFAAIGRMSLTTYLSQSVLCTLVFYGYGLGLYGQVGVISGLVLAILLFIAQVRLSEWWLERHAWGPLEWAWRIFTYGTLHLSPTNTEGVQSLPIRERLRQAAKGAAAQIRARPALVGLAVVALAAGVVVYGSLHGTDAPAIEEGRSQTRQVTRQATQTPTLATADKTWVVATPVVEPVPYEPGPLAASGDVWALTSALSTQSMVDQIHVLTGPPYNGRYAGSSEGWAAGDYIAERFAQYGLQPAGEGGSFFQPFPVDYVALAAVPELVVRKADGTSHDRYVLYQDYSPVLRWYAGAGAAEGDVVWASNCSQEDLAVAVAGKVVLCRDVASQEAQRNVLEHGQPGLLLLTDPEQQPADWGSILRDAWVPVPLPTFRVYPAVVEDLLVGSGLAIEDLTLRYEPFALPAAVQMRVVTAGSEACPNQTCRGRNVLGVLPGRDPRYSDQVVIVGAHYDHLGQGPDGTVWGGANDDASGMALLLEIARSWREQGYVPRRTVLFAAWDAEEMGLLGSRYYVDHPRYPLENTVAKLQFDMVGAGHEPLWIDGSAELGARIRAAAEFAGVEAEISNTGGSDHVPFLAVGIPASVLVWSAEEGATATYHTSADTPATIDPARLETAGQIGGVTLLSLCEGEPAIDDLLLARAAAVERGDLQAFMDLSLPEVEEVERDWFVRTQALEPVHLEMEAKGLRILGHEAAAVVQMTLEHQAIAGKEGAAVEIKRAALDARFVYSPEGWKWAGPNLVWVHPPGGFSVAVPPGSEATVEELGQLAAEQYAEMAARLGLPTQLDAALMLFPTAEALRNSLGFSVAGDADPLAREVVVQPGLIRMTYARGQDSNSPLFTALSQLLLTEAGVTPSAAPWLWQGLPLVLRVQQDPGSAPSLAELRQALDSGPDTLEATRAWAEVEYMRRRWGWQGLGQFVRELGAACRESGARQGADPVGIALSGTWQMDATAFEQAWQGEWRARLEALQSEVDAVLAKRTEAVLAGDRDHFLETVDGSVPALLEEERRWFERLPARPVEEFDLQGVPMAWLEDGSIVTSVTMSYRLSGTAQQWDEESVSLTVLLSPEGEGYRWSGPPFQALQSGPFSVLYPPGQHEVAQSVLTETVTLYGRLAERLGVKQGASVIKLYDDDQAFRTSIGLSFPLLDWVPAWSDGIGPGESTALKIRLNKIPTPEQVRSVLATQLTRQLLYRAGIKSEWFVKGMAMVLSRELNDRPVRQVTGADLSDLRAAVEQGQVYPLSALPNDVDLPEDELRIVTAQVQSTFDYLTGVLAPAARSAAVPAGEAHEGVLWSLLELQKQGLSLDAAMQQVIGRTLAEFEVEWADSLARAHARPEWVEIAQAFDPTRALEHIRYLSAPELRGRQAGSPGAQAAAAYIAGRFAEYGLAPASSTWGGSTCAFGLYAALSHQLHGVDLCPTPGDPGCGKSNPGVRVS